MGSVRTIKKKIGQLEIDCEVDEVTSMQGELKAGDRVRVIEPFSDVYQVGDTFEVKEVDSDGDIQAGTFFFISKHYVEKLQDVETGFIHLNGKRYALLKRRPEDGDEALVVNNARLDRHSLKLGSLITLNFTPHGTPQAEGQSESSMDNEDFVAVKYIEDLPEEEGVNELETLLSFLENKHKEAVGDFYLAPSLSKEESKASGAKQAYKIALLELKRILNK